MLQRILGGVLVLLGLAAVALGVASATVWRDSDTVVATAEPVGDGTMVVTDPGVLGLVSGDVTVTATAPDGQPVTLVVGRDVDVLGWIGKDPYSRVTGLQDWDTLAVEAGQAPEAEEGASEDGEEQAAPSGADPAGSDMWIAETSEDGTATLRWSDQPGRWTLLAAGVGEDAQAPTLELTWPRAVSTPYLWPAVGVGTLLVVVGLVIFVVGVRRGRRRKDDAPRGGSALGTQPDPEGDPEDAAPARPDDAPEGGSTNPFAPVRAASPVAALPAPSAAEEPATDVEDARHADDPEASGTAEVPVAGRLLRRSRRRTEAADALAVEPTPAEPVAAGAAEPTAAPALWTPDGAAPVPVAATADAGTPASEPQPVPEARPATGSAPGLSRRELRAQEEARRAAEQGGMTRMLRAITGSIPAVRPQAPAAPAQPEAERPAVHDLSTPAGRAAAWRATWGFGQGASGDAATTHDPSTTDGENR